MRERGSSGQPLLGRRIAVLVADGFEQIELAEPIEALLEAGAETQIVAPATGRVRAWNQAKWGMYFTIETPLDRANVEGFDALVVPGGASGAELLRGEEDVSRFVGGFHRAGKPIGAIGAGVLVLLPSGIVRGRRVAAAGPVATELEAAGARAVDEAVVIDPPVISCRKPADLHAFSRRLIRALAGAGPLHRTPARHPPAAPGQQPPGRRDARNSGA